MKMLRFIYFTTQSINRNLNKELIKINLFADIILNWHSI